MASILAKPEFAKLIEKHMKNKDFERLLKVEKISIWHPVGTSRRQVGSRRLEVDSRSAEIGSKTAQDDPAEVKSGMAELKRSLAELKRGLAELKRGLAELKSESKLAQIWGTLGLRQVKVSPSCPQVSHNCCQVDSRWLQYWQSPNLQNCLKNK